MRLWPRPEIAAFSADSSAATGRGLPAAFHGDCVKLAQKHLGVHLSKLSQTRYESGDGRIRLMCAVSAIHDESRDVPYFWFGFRVSQLEFLKAAEQAYVCLGCSSAEATLLVPLAFIQSSLDLMSVSVVAQHRIIRRSANGRLTSYLLALACRFTPCEWLAYVRVKAIEAWKARFVEEDDALRETSVTGEIPTLRNRADKRSPEVIESPGRHNQRVASARLLTALDGTQVDVINVSTVHLIEPRGPQPEHPARCDPQGLAQRSDCIPPSVGPSCTVSCAGSRRLSASVAASFPSQSARERPWAAAFAARAAACSSGS